MHRGGGGMGDIDARISGERLARGGGEGMEGRPGWIQRFVIIDIKHGLIRFLGEAISCSVRRPPRQDESKIRSSVLIALSMYSAHISYLSSIL